MIDKEWTDHKNGYRYYINSVGDKVCIKIATYPEREKIFETYMDKLEYIAFINYLGIGE